MVDVLDVAYAIQVEAHDRTALALVTAGALAPSELADVRESFDTKLAAPPALGQVIDAEQYQLRKALGVA